MSKWPERRVSLPQDQPIRYFASLQVRVSGFVRLCTIAYLYFTREEETVARMERVATCLSHPPEEQQGTKN